MLFLTILYASVFYQLLRSFWEQDNVWYKDPRFWIHIFTVLILTFVTLH